MFDLLPSVPEMQVIASINRPVPAGESAVVRLVDLGSGDGRICLEAARRGIFGEGIEINPWLVWYSQFKARALGLDPSLTKFRIGDYWKLDLAEYDVVVIYGMVSDRMPRLDASPSSSSLLSSPCLTPRLLCSALFSPSLVHSHDPRLTVSPR
jgi:hypothetical protein